MLFQEYARVLASLTKTFAAEADPGAALFQYVVLDAEIEQIAFGGNSLAVKNVEFGFAEGRSDFVFHHFAARTRTNHAIAFFDRLNSPDIQPDGRIKFERTAASGRFRIAEHHSNLFTNLVDENQAGARLRNDAGQLAQRLRHQSRLQAHLRIAHVAFECRAWHQRGHGVDHHYV